MSKQTIKKSLALAGFLDRSSTICCSECYKEETHPTGIYPAAEAFTDKGWVLKDGEIFCMECDKKTMS